MIEVKNYGTRSVTLAFEGCLLTIKPGQNALLDEKLYQTYTKIFPALKPFTESVIIESDTDTIKPVVKKKPASKGRKRK